MRITYEREKLIGQGNYGTVFHGLWNGVQVAVKRVEPGKDHSLDLVEREQSILKELDHPNVVKLYDVEEEVPPWYIDNQNCLLSILC